MKLSRIFSVVLPIVIIGLFFSCRKSLDEPVYSPSAGTDSIQLIRVDSVNAGPLTFGVQCLEGPDYGDSIIYPQPVNQGQEYIVSPTNPASGIYMSFPKGLSMDTKSGAINITKSATGMRYQIGFVKSGAKDTCFHPIILAGSSYLDSVYVLNDKLTYANPYFNANPNISSACATGTGCRFDINHKGTMKGIKIDQETGVMELSKSKDIFGPIPFNGQFADVTMDYSLNDKSNYAIQQMSLRFIYFNRSSDIPSWLTNMIKDRSEDALQNIIINSPVGSPKPTMIIITRYK